NQRFLPAPFHKGAFGVHRPKPPLLKGGASACRGGGLPWPRPRHLFTIPSSLFPKQPSPFHMGLYFQKVPTVNPSVKNQRFLPAPFSKGAFGVHRPKPPLRKGGASAPPRRGDSVAKATELIHYSLFTFH